MKSALGHLTFCTNIFPGESWEEHFSALKKYIPNIKKRLVPDSSFGIGLRLSEKASSQLYKKEHLQAFQQWLDDNDCYVFTMNGFPYGNFHGSRVKEKVHAPDWTTQDRLTYTLRLFHILSALLPNGMEGSISTSPLYYKYIDNKEIPSEEIRLKCTQNIVALITELIKIHRDSGKILHLNIEPEADGGIESADEFITWFTQELLPVGTASLQETFSFSKKESEKAIKNHLRLCYDVCHFAVGFEDIEAVLEKLHREGIRVGKWQLSAALKINIAAETQKEMLDRLKQFDEPVYLHQVVAWQADGGLLRYRDLQDAFNDPKALKAKEWRSHFHVPLFIKEYGLLQSTQAEVIRSLEVLKKKQNDAEHLEVETYTWDVLPKELKMPIGESIVREMEWVINRL